MEITADLHIHSRFARATSRYLDIPHIVHWSRLKGLQLTGTGDFTHPAWMEELKGLEERDGLLWYEGYPLMLSVEVNNMFEYEGHPVNIHNVILTDSLDSAQQINDFLSNYGDLGADGRPNLKLSMQEMLDELKLLNPKTEVFPAHIWTPWFSILGARNKLSSIFDVVDDRILAIETGLSSDPPMNWITEARRFPIISNSDAHSPKNLAREATVLDVKELSYDEVIKAIKENKIIKTYEYYPQEGKYYWDGHRKCNVSFPPEESLKLNNRCPVCGKKLTIGVLHRVMELADKPLGYKPPSARPFKHIIPLHQSLSKILNKPITSKKVEEMYHQLVNYFGSELNVLEAPLERLRLAMDPLLAKKLYAINQGQISWKPGYDGVFGEFTLGEIEHKKQTSLGDFE
ncbi:MAG: DNA helicase UvrD [Candidatus Micrarchaeota archaeon]|nr:DNA helicase UvrD [Candidatus Micrarchaeota archaeon]